MLSTNGPTIIYLQDFVEAVRPDPTCLDQQAAIQLQTILNIPSLQPDEQSNDLEICPVPALVQIFILPGQLHLYQREVFIYVMGLFYMVPSPDSQPQMIVNAYTAD